MYLDVDGANAARFFFSLGDSAAKYHRFAYVVTQVGSEYISRFNNFASVFKRNASMLASS